LAAKGEGWGGARVERGLRYSRKEEEISSGMTRWFGMNLRACYKLAYEEERQCMLHSSQINLRRDSVCFPSG